MNRSHFLGGYNAQSARLNNRIKKSKYSHERGGGNRGGGGGDGDINLPPPANRRGLADVHATPTSDYTPETPDDPEDDNEVEFNLGAQYDEVLTPAQHRERRLARIEESGRKADSDIRQLYEMRGNGEISTEELAAGLKSVKMRHNRELQMANAPIDPKLIRVPTDTPGPAPTPMSSRTADFPRRRPRHGSDEIELVEGVRPGESLQDDRNRRYLREMGEINAAHRGNRMSPDERNRRMEDVRRRFEEERARENAEGKEEEEGGSGGGGGGEGSGESAGSGSGEGSGSGGPGEGAGEAPAPTPAPAAAPPSGPSQAGPTLPPPYPKNPDGSDAKAVGPDMNRVDPITPATGSTQTPASANSLMQEANSMMKDIKKSSNPEAIFGTAEERANMGKGAPSGYEFGGPYDYPTTPSGRKDTSLTALGGGWRSKTGEHSASLWKSTMTSKGVPAMRDKYYKWSTKDGGRWSNIKGADAMRVFSKMEARKQGGRFMDRPNPNQSLTHFMKKELKRKDRDVQLAKIGGEIENKRRKFTDGGD